MSRLRLQGEFCDLDLPPGCALNFPDPSNLMHFRVEVVPQEGYWQGEPYFFDFQVPNTYPHHPPKLKCSPQIWHPNIDLDGNVCLNILRLDWRPIMGIIDIIFGLLLLFGEPEVEDALNLEAAQELRENPKKFGDTVRATIKKGQYGSTSKIQTDCPSKVFQA